MDWRQNSKGQSYRKLNGITSLYEDKTVLQSFFYFNEETCTILLRAGKKPTFIYKNLEHKSTTVQLGSGRTVEGFFRLLSLIKTLTLSSESWSPAETNGSQMQSNLWHHLPCFQVATISGSKLSFNIQSSQEEAAPFHPHPHKQGFETARAPGSQMAISYKEFKTYNFGLDGAPSVCFLLIS